MNASKNAINFIGVSIFSAIAQLHGGAMIDYLNETRLSALKSAKKNIGYIIDNSSDKENQDTVLDWLKEGLNDPEYEIETSMLVLLLHQTGNTIGSDLQKLMKEVIERHDLGGMQADQEMILDKLLLGIKPEGAVYKTPEKPVKDAIDESLKGLTGFMMRGSSTIQ